MDIFTFTASAAALAPYWAKYVQIGRETAAFVPVKTFTALWPVRKRSASCSRLPMGGIPTEVDARTGKVLEANIDGNDTRMTDPAACRESTV